MFETSFTWASTTTTTTHMADGWRKREREEEVERERVFKLRVTYPELECRTPLLSSNSK